MTFMQGIYNYIYIYYIYIYIYIPVTKDVCMVHKVTAVLLLQYMVYVVLFF